MPDGATFQYDSPSLGKVITLTCDLTSPHTGNHGASLGAGLGRVWWTSGNALGESQESGVALGSTPVITSFARTVLDDIDAAAARTTLGVVVGTTSDKFASGDVGLPVASGPAAPTGVALTAGSGMVMLQWNANTDIDVRRGFGQYRVEVGPSSGGWTTYASFITGGTDFTIGSAPAGTDRGYRVVAIDWQGNESSPSSVVTGQPNLVKPSNMLAVSATAPAALGSATAGSADAAARSDHVHPTTGLALSGHVHSLIGVTLGTADVFVGQGTVATGTTTALYSDITSALNSLNVVPDGGVSPFQIEIPQAEVGNAILLSGYISFGANSTGRRIGTVSWKPKSSGSWSALAAITSPSVGASDTTEVVFPMMASKPSWAAAADAILVKVDAWQNSGSSLQVQGRMIFVRVA